MANTKTKVEVKFVGIDSWNRPVFKQVDDKKYFGSTCNLYGYGEEEKCIEFYSNNENLNSLVYFGSSFDCEPMGTLLDQMKVPLELYLEGTIPEETQYFTNIFGEKFLRNPNLVDLELLSTEIKAIKKLVENYTEKEATPDEKMFLFYPLIAKLEDALSEENLKKSREKSLIK